MRTWTSHLDAITVLAALCGALAVGGCQKHDSPAPVPKTANVPIDTTSQTTTPAPPGDSTPTAAKEGGQPGGGANDKAGTQSTVGTSASGAPPETQQSAPEGNPAPKGGDVKK